MSNTTTKPAGYIKNVAGLRAYVSKPTDDHSLTYNILVSPLCDYLVRLVPSWFAPNLITVFGFVVSIGSFILAATMLGLDADFRNGEKDTQSWVYIAIGLCFFAYMMVDNLDGKQARKTHTSSALGELFDHGCDAITVTTAAMTSGMLAGAGPWSCMFIFATATLPFYLAHWEEYFTHSLTLGMLNGPTEAQLAIVIVSAVSFIFGRGFWQATIPLPSFVSSALLQVPIPLLHLTEIQRNSLLILFVGCTNIFTSLSSIVSAISRASKMGVKPSDALMQLIPFGASYALCALWLWSRPLLYEAHPYLLSSAFGFTFAYLVSRCIVQRICSEPYALFYTIITPLALACLNSFLSYATHEAPVVPEEVAAGLVWTSSFLFWSYFVYSISLEMSRHLGIRVFSLDYKRKHIKRR